MIKKIENIIHFDTIDSTNNYLKNNFVNFDVNSAVFALNQTKGKGRFERNWINGKGSSILVSFLIKNTTIVEAIQLTFFFSLVIRKFLNKYLDIENKQKLRLKWPNDILIDNRKICGILSEFKDGNAIIGAGINIFPFKIIDDILQNKVVSLQELSSKKLPDLASLQEELINVINSSINISNSPQELLDKWLKTANLLNKKVTIAQSGDDKNITYRSGVVVGISGLGELIIKNNNSTITINHGDLTFNDKF